MWKGQFKVDLKPSALAKAEDSWKSLPNGQSFVPSMVRLDPSKGEFKGLARQVAQMQGHIAPSYSILEEPWACNKTKKSTRKVPTDWSCSFCLVEFLVVFV